MFSDALLTLHWRRRRTRSTGAAANPRSRGGHSVGEAVAPLSTRKLAASLWRYADTSPVGGSVRWQRGLSFDRLGFQFRSSMAIPKFAMEGATRSWDCADDFESNVKLNSSSTAFVGKDELSMSRKHVNEREAKGGRSRKMNEERSLSMQRRMWSVNVMKKLAEGIESERKNCKSMDRMNSKVLRDIAEARASTRELIWNLQREKKARKVLEGVCYDLANEIKGRKAEIGALRNEQRRIKESMEEERQMRQIAEVWREEAALMKLADARLILEDKKAEMNELLVGLREFVRQGQLPAIESPVEAGPKALAVVEDDANRSQVLLDKSGVVVNHEAEILNSKMRGGNLINGRKPHRDIVWPKLDSQKMRLRDLLKHDTAA